MKDKNGREIKIGDRAVVVRADKGNVVPSGSIGTVRNIKLAVGALRGKPGCLVKDGPDDDPNWAAWVRGDEIAVV